jgi:hypothetical protein
MRKTYRHLSGDFTMNIQFKILLSLIVSTTLGWSSVSYAGCTPAQMTGFWEAAFSDGNSCRLKLILGGNIDLEKSICYDPDRGTAGIDSGTIKVDAHCFAEGVVVIGGTTVELPVQFSSDRGTAAGRFRVPATGSKGSIVMIRVP